MDTPAKPHVTEADSPESGEEKQHKELLDRLRSKVEEMDPGSAGIDDATLNRFLRARALSIEKASKLFVQQQRWRRSFVPLGCVPEEQVQNELQAQKIFLQGYDKIGRPIGVFLLGRHDAFKRDLDEFKRFAVYCFDKAIASISTKQEKFLVIADLEHWGYKNMDMKGCLAVLQILQDYYPERLGRVFVLHVPYAFWALWKFIYPFMDKVTREKIIFVDDKNLQTTLLKEIDESNLPQKYGGKSPFIPIQNCVVSQNQYLQRK